MFPFDLMGSSKVKFSLDELFMLFVALLLDLISLVLICLCLDDFGIMDTCGWIIIGIWSFVKNGSMPSRKGKSQGSNIISRFMGTGIIELIPYIGAFPTWTLYVYSAAKGRCDEENAIRVQNQIEEEMGEIGEEEEENLEEPI
jgi:hypothetical protein